MQCPIAQTWESAPKQWAVMAIVEGRSPTFETVLRQLIGCIYLCGIKTKTHFEWFLWHWSSLDQLNLEPTRPNGLLGCKVPTDLVKISVKEATHMGFHYITHWPIRDVKVIFVYFKVTLWIDILRTSSEIGLRWVPHNPIYNKSTLVQATAWCHQATSHYLSWC